MSAMFHCLLSAWLAGVMVKSLDLQSDGLHVNCRPCTVR